jgi:carboxyl-terminal processing protease
MKKLLIIFFLFTVIISSCKKDVPPAPTTVTAAEQGRDALYGLLQEWYFWYKDLPPIDVKGVKDPYKLMDTLRYKPLDRWSFVADYNAFVASMQGTFVGHGIRIGLDPQGKARIVTIYQNSPLYANGTTNPRGVRRGWIIKSLNGQDLAAILASGNAAAYNTLMQPAQAGIINTFVFTTPRGNDTTAVTTKKSFQVNSVMLYDTLTINSKKTGHLVFDEFIEPSSLELQTAFAFFKAQNVKDLILDLRYNGGGILNVATELASYIAGTSKFGTPFVSSAYNDKKKSEETTTNFKTILSPLDLTRLVVITTRETASASEVIINGLRPHLAVTTIGDTTNGKPTGMNVWSDLNYKYIFAPITFKLVNSALQGDFYAGFAPAKNVPDDITRDFTDKNELCFKEAIYFLANGTVSTKGTYMYKPSIQRSEKPAWMRNMYIFDKLPVLR